MVLVGPGWAHKGAETYDYAVAGDVWVVGVEAQTKRIKITPGRIARI